MGLHPVAYYLGWIFSHYIKILVIVGFIFCAVLPSFNNVNFINY